MVKVTRKNITPQVAENLLDNLYERQRAVKPQVVKRYAEAMRNGEWLTTGDTIKLSEDGKVMDGQHRLRAIVESGFTLEGAIIIQGVDEDAFNVMDQGRPRTFADWLTSDGVGKTANALAAAVNATFRYKYNSKFTVGGGVKPGINLLIQTYRDENIERWVTRGIELGRTFSFPSAPLIAFLYVAELSQAANVEEFAEALLKGEGLAATHPAYLARQALIKRMSLAPGKRLPADTYMTELVWCWNAFAEEREVDKIRIRKGEEVTVLDPHGHVYEWQHEDDEPEPEEQTEG